MRRAGGQRVALVLALAIPVAVATACGETRRPIGDECVRSDDCLSGVCSSRTCVSAPGLVNGAGGPPPNEVPRIPVGEAGGGMTDDSSTDATGGG
jgi:hypothetical protein